MKHLVFTSLLGVEVYILEDYSFECEGIIFDGEHAEIEAINYARDFVAC